MPRLDRRAAARQQLIERQLTRAGDLRNDLHEPVALIRRLSCAPTCCAHPLERRGEARVVDRFQQVVHRARLEGLDRVLVVSRDEHHDGQRLLRQMRQHLEARHARHLDVEKHQVGLVLDDRGERLAAVGALRHDFEIAGARASRISMPRRDSASSSTMIVLIFMRAPSEAASVARLDASRAGAISSGSAMSMRSPG